jgi:hypothetical protein
MQLLHTDTARLRHYRVILRNSWFGPSGQLAQFESITKIHKVLDICFEQLHSLSIARQEQPVPMPSCSLQQCIKEVSKFKEAQI